jgi:hypothetical protein
MVTLGWECWCWRDGGSGVGVGGGVCGGLGDSTGLRLSFLIFRLYSRFFHLFISSF